MAIVDVASGLLAKDGALAESLALAVGSKEFSESAELIGVAGALMDGWRIPIGSDPPVGYLSPPTASTGKACRPMPRRLGSRRR